MFQHTIELSATETLQLTWRKNYRNLTVSLNGRLLGTIPDKATLKLGRSFKLADERQFIVVLTSNRLAVWHNQLDLLSGVVSGKRDYFTTTVGFLLFTGGVFFTYDLYKAISLFPRSYFEAHLPDIAGPGLTLLSLGIWAKLSNALFPIKLAASAAFLILIIKPFLVPGISILGIVLLLLLLYQLYLGIKHGPIPSQRPTIIDKDRPLDHGI